MRIEKLLAGLVFAGALALIGDTQAESKNTTYLEKFKALRNQIKAEGLACKGLEKLASKADRNPESFEDKLLAATEGCAEKTGNLLTSYEEILYPEDGEPEDELPGDEDNF